MLHQCFVIVQSELKARGTLSFVNEAFGPTEDLVFYSDPIIYWYWILNFTLNIFAYVTIDLVIFRETTMLTNNCAFFDLNVNPKGCPITNFRLSTKRLSQVEAVGLIVNGLSQTVFTVSTTSHNSCSLMYGNTGRLITVSQIWFAIFPPTCEFIYRWEHCCSDTGPG